MRIDLDNLPVDTALLHHLVRDMAAVVEHRDGEIERLKLIIKKLQRAQFGRRPNGWTMISWRSLLTTSKAILARSRGEPSSHHCRDRRRAAKAQAAA
jgi:hypothetical protein